MEIKLLPAEPRHLEQLEELEKLCFSDPWGRNILESRLRDERSFFPVAEDESGTVAGYADMSWVLDEGYICNVAVAPDFRRQGLGDRLMDELRSAAERLSLSFLTLEVRAGNAPAVALYEKHGYKVVGRRKNYYENPKEDAILMTLFLEEKTC